MLGTMEQRTKGMKKQAQELIEQAYNRGYRAGQENALTVDSDKLIEQGRNMAWEAARKIVNSYHCNLNGEPSKYEDLFGKYLTCNIFDMSASEAIEKIHTYEDEKKKQEEDSEIQVGDEVYLLDSTDPSVVTCIFENFGVATAVQITSNGRWVVNNIRDLHKTGRHFGEIENVLEKLKEGNNG